MSVCAGDQPQNWMQHQTVWLVQALDDSILEGAVKSGNINLFLVGIITGPEQVSGHPVHCQAVSVGQIWRKINTRRHQSSLSVMFNAVTCSFL